jgi:hypothetical protein
MLSNAVPLQLGLNFFKNNIVSEIVGCLSRYSDGDFSLTHSVQTSSGAHPVGTEGSFPRGQVAGASS